VTSSSYVSQTKNRFDDYNNEFEAMMDRQDAELEQMFGENIFENSGTTSATVESEGPGIAESNGTRSRTTSGTADQAHCRDGTWIRSDPSRDNALSLISSEIQHRITDSFSLLDPTV